MSSIYKSLVIASENVHELSKFYVFALDGELFSPSNEENHCIVLAEGIKVHFYQPSKNDPSPQKGRASALCLEYHPPSPSPLIVIKEWASSLISRGALIAEEPRLKSFGAESWMTDPEGNFFLLFVPGS